jgi:hypothetical protein
LSPVTRSHEITLTVWPWWRFFRMGGLQLLLEDVRLPAGVSRVSSWRWGRRRS